MTGRQQIAEMVNQYVSTNGVRRFPDGFSGEWLFLRSRFEKLGYDLRKAKNWYTLRPIGAAGRPKRMSRDSILREIDLVLIAHGQEPFVKREASQ